MWRIVASGTLALSLAAAAAHAQPKTEQLWPQGAPGATGDEEKDRPTLIIHLPVKPLTPSAAVVIFPGGGYARLAMDHEGRAIAEWLNSLGIAAFVCDYRHRGKGYGHPAPLQDAQRAIRTVRARADEFGVDAARVGVLGFSAGGHLASTAATHFDAGQADAADPVERAGCRPDFAILCYPVIAFGEPHTHLGSQRNLLGNNPQADLVEQLSSEKQVTPDTPPTFLWHTNEDRTVPPENSVQFYLALRRANVPAELHIYEHGRHGLGLAEELPSASAWSKQCEAWLWSRRILNARQR